MTTGLPNAGDWRSTVVERERAASRHYIAVMAEKVNPLHGAEAREQTEHASEAEANAWRLATSRDVYNALVTEELSRLVRSSQADVCTLWEQAPAATRALPSGLSAEMAAAPRAILSAALDLAPVQLDEHRAAANLCAKGPRWPSDKLALAELHVRPGAPARDDNASTDQRRVSLRVATAVRTELCALVRAAAPASASEDDVAKMLQALAKPLWGLDVLTAEFELTRERRMQLELELASLRWSHVQPMLLFLQEACATDARVAAVVQERFRLLCREQLLQRRVAGVLNVLSSLRRSRQSGRRAAFCREHPGTLAPSCIEGLPAFDVDLFELFIAPHLGPRDAVALQRTCHALGGKGSRLQAAIAALTPRLCIRTIPFKLPHAIDKDGNRVVFGDHELIVVVDLVVRRRRPVKLQVLHVEELGGLERSIPLEPHEPGYRIDEDTGKVLVGKLSHDHQRRVGPNPELYWDDTEALVSNDSVALRKAQDHKNFLRTVYPKHTEELLDLEYSHERISWLDVFGTLSVPLQLSLVDAESGRKICSTPTPALTPTKKGGRLGTFFPQCVIPGKLDLAWKQALPAVQRVFVNVTSARGDLRGHRFAIRVDTRCAAREVTPSCQAPAFTLSATSVPFKSLSQPNVGKKRVREP